VRLSSFQTTHYLIQKQIRDMYSSEGKTLDLIWMVSGRKTWEPGVTGNKFCTAVSNICGSRVWELLLVTILHLKFWSGLYIWNIYRYSARKHIVCINPTPFDKIANIYKAWISDALKSALPTVVFQENSGLKGCVFPEITLFIPAGIA